MLRQIGVVLTIFLIACVCLGNVSAATDVYGEGGSGSGSPRRFIQRYEQHPDFGPVIKHATVYQECRKGPVIRYVVKDIQSDKEIGVVYARGAKYLPEAVKSLENPSFRIEWSYRDIGGNGLFSRPCGCFC